MYNKKKVLIIACSDSSGGAGIQQDIKISDRMGFWSYSVISGITLQREKGLDDIFVIEDQIFQEQLNYCLKNYNFDGIKIGAIASINHVKFVGKKILGLSIPIVLDPVFSPTVGSSFISKDLINSYIDSIFPSVSIITPNKSELEYITGKSVNCFQRAIEMAKEISRKYRSSIYLKGGHFQGKLIHDAWIDKNSDFFLLEKKKKKYNYFHGSGCALSTLLLCNIIKNGVSRETLIGVNDQFARYFAGLNK